ncbi:hypothetical protein C7I55_01225 [Sphingomonas deserti]|uniref:Glycoside hydrolase family 65 n=1 Tax=Allosphingosinicella deserti TaxID=2116704 RepID=A0A2P7R062_9SPHN|nr:hypothetical protein C7I55_01225 [Sphingomonas deserti]
MLGLLGLLGFASVALAAEPIDRRALVTRHSPKLDAIDPHAPLMVGNGTLGFTADITGLQTFPDRYSALAPLLTMAQWAWHSFPNANGYSETDGLVDVAVPERGTQPYAWMHDWSEAERRPALTWLRENPHRFSLGRIALAMVGADGKAATFEDISATRQHLDLWTGTLSSRFRFGGEDVAVETRVHPDRDMVLISIRSPLVATGRIGVDVRFPGVAAKLNPDPSDWTRDSAHRTNVAAEAPGRMLVERRLDDTVYWSEILSPSARIEIRGPHTVHIAGRGDRLLVSVSFEQQRSAPQAIDIARATADVAAHWQTYWTTGGAIDFSGSTDPRAAELERRVILSRYLAAINQAGEVPPQEEGLFSNSWNGKFHLEMHAWHSGHFATWDQADRLERSLGWYLEHLPSAQAEARRHKVDGAWWPKMVGPEGRNSPSTINPFIMWQQPHPIYLAELVYRARPSPDVLARYAAVVEETARLLATWPRWDASSGRYRLGPPIIPVQENHAPLTTLNPTFEIEYFRWGLETAQAWRMRRGLAREAHWDAVIAKLSPPPERNGLYLPVESAPDFWTISALPQCSRHATAPTCLNRDHPSFLMAYGLIAGARTDPATMRRTLAATEAHWDTRQTWGWDFPMVAMAAARLGEPEKAVDWLFKDLPNNRWGASGMTPRVHLEEHAAAFVPGAGAGESPDGPGFRRAAETYFPSNGSLLLAVGMMAAGWDGSSGHAPGFPKQGWRVQVENIRPLP